MRNQLTTVIRVSRKFLILLPALAFLAAAPMQAGLADFGVISLGGSITALNDFAVSATSGNPGNIGALTTIDIGNLSGGTGIAGGAVAEAAGPIVAITNGGDTVAGNCATAGPTSTVSGGANCGGVVTTGLDPLIGLFDAAVTEAATLSASLSALTPTDNHVAISGNTDVTLTPTTSPSLDPIVWNIPSIDFHNATLTVVGAATDTVVINTPSLTLGNSADIALSGGLLPTNLIFNLGALSVTGNSGNWNGTFYIDSTGCSISNSFDLDGALVCSGNIDLGNNAHINHYAFVNNLPTPTPEPATSLLLGAGLAGLLILARRKSKRAV